MKQIHVDTKIYLLIVLTFIVNAIYATPARNITKLLPTVDGKQIEAILHGDEVFHYYTTTDGQMLLSDSTGLYHIATEFERESKLNYAKLKKQNFELSNTQTPLQYKYNNVYDKLTKSTQAEKKSLVILVNFSDIHFEEGHDKNLFYDLFNKNGFDYHGHVGSVSDYFYEQSYGKLDLKFDVVGPYNLSHEASYYGENTSIGGDSNPGEMVKEAILLANNDVNYNNYDWDGDGYVDQVYVIYAGASEASGAPSWTIWPHKWNLHSAIGHSIILDGIKIDTYACSSELYENDSDLIDCIGSAVHEFCHCLGLVDMYDTISQSAYGLRSWSVMDDGCYNGPDDYAGCVPMGLTAYEKMSCGWLTPIELNEPCNISKMKSISTSNEAYIIYNDAFHDEYYILQNIQQEGWYKYAPGTGLLVIHVDYDLDIWMDNHVNTDESHMRVTVIPADNSFGRLGIDVEGDTYPGTSNNHSLTDYSIPCASLYNQNIDGNNLMGKPIEDITESNDGLISFKFMGGEKTSALRDMSIKNDNNITYYNIYGQKLRKANLGINIVDRRKIYIY